MCANLLIKSVNIYYMQDHVSSYKLSTAALLLRLPQIIISERLRNFSTSTSTDIHTPPPSFHRPPTQDFPILNSTCNRNPINPIMATITVPRTPVPPTSQPAFTTNTSKSHPYTCNSCQVAFRSSDLQRTHMRSDWQ